MRSACTGEPFYQEHEGQRYCVLHFPGKEKSADFKRVLQRKLESKDFNFGGVWFPDEVSFSKFKFGTTGDFSFATFSRAADFSFATFSGAADFNSANFSAAANFDSATFSAAARFSIATFSATANFSFATFSAPAYFISATFNAAADFSWATFSAVAYFTSATFGDRVRFAGIKNHQALADTSELDLQFARIEKPDHVSFHTLSLRPHWFVNVDARKFDFTNVDWRWRRVNEEIGGLKGSNLSSAHNMLFIASRRLADNAEENHRYEEASRFRYLAMEAKRLEHSHGLAPWRLSWWYWLASGYGERALRAFLVLLGMWFVAGLLYIRVGFVRWEPKLASESDIAVAKRDDFGAPLKLSRALTYSAAVMTFQKPEPRPATTGAQTVVLIETILGPVQAALLALAIRRKFMR